MVICPRSIHNVIRDMVIVPTAQFAWAHGLHASKRVIMPVLLTGILITEKLDQEIERTEISTEL